MSEALRFVIRPTPTLFAAAMLCVSGPLVWAQSAVLTDPADIVLTCSVSPTSCSSRINVATAASGCGDESDPIPTSNMGIVAGALILLLERDAGRPDILKALDALMGYFDSCDPIIAAAITEQVAQMENAGWQQIGLDKTLADNAALAASPN